MRAMVLSLTLLLAACGGADEPTNGIVAAPEASQAAYASFAAAGRDRLCIAEQGGKASFVTYAEGTDANCLVRGSWSPGGPQAIKPDGDPSCSIIFNKDQQEIRLVAGGPGCAYYCGPGASFAGKTFTRMAKPEPVSDIVGDPLC